MDALLLDAAATLPAGSAVAAADAAHAPLLADPLPSEDEVARSLGEDWAFVYRNADYLLRGAVVTVVLTFVSILLGFLAGFPAGAIEVYGEGYARAAVRKAGVVLRGTPILVIIIFSFFVLPVGDLAGPVNGLIGAINAVLRAVSAPFGSTAVVLPTVSEAFVAATVALGLRSAAYQSQIFRGALGSVDEGQMEAARSIGMSRLGAIRHVVVPQALRRSVPGFQNEFTIVLKDTSIAFAIGLGELLKNSNDLFIQQNTAVLEVILFASLVYFALTFGTNRTLDFVNDRFAVPGESA